MSLGTALCTGGLRLLPPTPHRSIIRIHHTSQLRASAPLNSPSRSQVARSALRLFWSSLFPSSARAAAVVGVVVCGALWVFFSALPPFSPPALRLFSPLCCLSGAVSALRRWRRRRHESHRQDRRRCPGLLWLFCDGALFRCSLDLNEKGRFFTRASPAVASGRLRPPPAASGHLRPSISPHNNGPPATVRRPKCPRWVVGLPWLARPRPSGRNTCALYFFCLLGGGDLDLSPGSCDSHCTKPATARPSEAARTRRNRTPCVVRSVWWLVAVVLDYAGRLGRCDHRASLAIAVGPGSLGRVTLPGRPRS